MHHMMDGENKDMSSLKAEPNSSEAYKQHLEEIEYKIRYMKNDIEFKQAQIKKRKWPEQANSKTQNENASSSNSYPAKLIYKSNSVSHKSKSIAKNYIPTSIVTTGPSKALENAKTQLLFSGSNEFSSIKVDSYPQHINPKPQFQTKSNIPLLSMGSQSNKALKNTSDLKSHIRTIYDVAKVSEIPSHGLIVHDATHMCQSNGMTGLSEEKITHIDKSNSNLCRSVLLSKSSSMSSDSRTVIFPKSHFSISTCIDTEHNLLHNGERTLAMPSNEEKKSSKIDQQTPINLQAITKSSKKSPYNYVAPKSEITHNLNPSISKTLHFKNSTEFLHSKSISPNQSRTILKRKSSSEIQNSKKMTPLKIKTAAKLVSKYKLSHISPTSISSINPHLHFPGRSFHVDLKQKLTSSSKGMLFKHSGNRYKLDKRQPKKEDSVVRNKDVSTLKQPSSNPSSKVFFMEDKKLYKNYGSIYHFCSNDNVKISATSSGKVVNRSTHNLAHFGRRDKTLKRATLGNKIISERFKNPHHWSCVDYKIRNLKRNFSAKRYAELTPFRLRHLKSEGTSLPKTVSTMSGLKPFKTDKRNLNLKKRHYHTMHTTGHQGQHHAVAPFVSQGLHRQQHNKLVMIRGVVYRSSPQSLRRAHIVGKESKPSYSDTVNLNNLRGICYHLDSRGKKFCRVKGLNEMTEKLSKSADKQSNLQAKLAASRAINRSLAFVAAKHKKDNRLKTSKQKHCIFYCRFGKCHRGDACPFVHDQKKVTICTRFLRGKCQVTNCLFSHDASVHKTPVCLYYLQGLCSRNDCLYLHVNVSRDAPPCKDFLNGYCSLGNKCKKLHSFLCPSFAVFGKCLKGEKCTLLHRQSRKLQAESHVHHSGPLDLIETLKSSDSPSVSVPQNLPSLTSRPAKLSPILVSQMIKENDTSIIYVSGKSSPLKSQPAFISLPTIVPSGNRNANASPRKDNHVVEMKQKIKPEFLHSNVDPRVMTTPTPPIEPESEQKQGESTVKVEIKILKSDVPSDHDLLSAGDYEIPITSNISELKAVKMGDSPSIIRERDEKDFISVESSNCTSYTLSSPTISKFDSGQSSSTSEQSMQKLGICEGGKSENLAAKKALFKGIIPNFLPLSKNTGFK